jgi:hypothetical protein
MGRDIRSNGSRGVGFCGLVLTVALFVVLGCGVLDALYAQGSSGDDGAAVVAAPSDAPGTGGPTVPVTAVAPVLRFAYKAAVSGNYAVVGAEWHDGFRGMAYLYRRDGDTWVEAQKLVPSDLGRYDHFGSAVAVSGDVAIVGAPWQDLFRGAVYVFVREGDRWVEREKLTARDGSVEGYFGRSVFVDGNGIVVMGAGRDAYRFERSNDGWVEKGNVSPAALPAVDAAAQTQVAEGIVYGSGRDPATFFGKENVTPPSPAPMAPIAPTWVKATGGSLSPLETEVKVTWSTSVQQDAIVFKVYRDGTLLSFVPSVETQYSDVTAVIGDTYEYCVVASDMVGGQSAPVCDPEEGGRIIFAPIDVSATDGIYIDKVNITWEDVSAINTGYSIRRDAAEIGTVGANTLWFDDTSAVPEVVYSYDVVATATGGYESAAATDTSGWRGVILPPTNVSASDGQYFDRVRITWQNQAPDTMVYAVYREDSLLGVTAANATSYVDSTVVYGVTYTYCVAAKEPETVTGIPAAGVGSNGPITTESVRMCDEGGTGLAAPGAVSASDSTYDDRIRVTWKDLSDFEDGYEVVRSAFGDTVVVYTTRADITLYDDFTAEPDVAYIYHVRAVSNMGGVSADSSDAGYRSKVLAPYEVVATDGTYEDHVDITWKSTSTTAALFNIYRGATFIKSLSKGDRLHRDYGGTAGEKYQYTVRAYTALGDSAVGAEDEGSRELKTPSSLVASDETYEDKIVISWTDNSRIEQGYVVSRRDTVAEMLLGSYDTPGTARAVAVVGDYAYVADDTSGVHVTSGLQVIDVSDPANPIGVGSYDTPDHAYDVCASGDYTYVADGIGGLQIVDVSDPANPVLAGSYDTAVFAMAVVVAGEYAYVADFYGKLRIIDVSDPANPNLVGSYDTPGYAFDVAVRGDYAFVSRENGLEIVDVSDPSNPEFMGAYSQTSLYLGLDVAGGFAYAGAGDSVLVIDVSEPAAPARARSIGVGSIVSQVRVVSNLMYVCANSLYVVDLSDPTTTLHSVDTPGDAIDVAVVGNHAFVADWTSGLEVYRASAIVTLDEYLGSNWTSYTDYTAVPGVVYRYSVAVFDSLGEAMGSSVAAADLGRRVLFAPTSVVADKGEAEDHVEITWRDYSDAEDGYRIYRDGVLIGTEPDRSISFLDTSPTFGRTHLYRVCAFDDYGESDADSDEGYTILFPPVSVNASDTYVNRVELTWLDRSQIEDGYIVARNGAPVDTVAENVTTFTDSLNITGARVSTTPFTLNGVTVVGDYAYAAADYGGGSWGLQVIDVSDPSDPKVGGVVYPPRSGRRGDVATVGNYVYLVSQYGELFVFDLTVPETPVYVTYVATSGNAWDVKVSGNYAYVAVEASGLRIFDITNPASPSNAGICDTPGAAYGVAIAGNYAYVADTESGLQIVDISVPGLASIVGSCSTPGAAIKVEVAGDSAYVATDIGLTIIDIRIPTNPKVVGSWLAPATAWGIAVVGDYAYVATLGFGLQIVDVSDPKDPRYAGAYETVDDAYSVDAGGGYAYVGGENEFAVVSLPPIYPGTPIDYCVRAYKGDASSERRCDEGVIRPASARDPDGVELLDRLTASDGTGYGFGWSVAISGTYAIVGAPSTGGMGAAYIFERSEDGDWVEKAKLSADTPASGDQFGASVAISGAWAFVGCPKDDTKATDAGAVFVFNRGTDGSWTRTKLIDASGLASDNFGCSVAMSGSRAMIGANYDDNSNGTNAGSAHIYDLVGSTWTWKQRVQSSVTGDREFGSSVSIDDDYAIVGTGDLGGIGTGTDAACIFERNGTTGTWAEKKRQTGPSWFGGSVAVYGDLAVVGSRYDTQWLGAAVVFERLGTGTWAQSQVLRASDGYRGDQFGYSVAMGNGRIVVGTPSYQGGAGAVYLFERASNGAWAEAQKLVAGDQTDRKTGASAAVGAETIIVGASESGAAYVLETVLSPRNVAASDGTLKNRVRVNWEDRALNEIGYRIYRDGEPLTTVDPNVQGYEDFDAEPGRTYLYGVAALTNEVANEAKPVTDFGWRPANGNITGRIATRGGAAADSVWLEVSPLQTRALLFDGNGGYVGVPDNAGTFDFSSADSFTVEAWIKYSGTGGSGAADAMIIAKASPVGGASRFPFTLGTMRGTGHPGRLQFSMRDGTTSASVSTSRDDINDNAWHHVACVRAADGSMQLYIDGVLEGSGSSAGLGDITNQEPLSFGVGPAADSWFGGQIDEVRFWSVARSSSQIRAGMTKPLAGAEADLVAYWPIGWPNGYRENRDPGVITDLSANAHYGTFEAGVYWTDEGITLDIFPVTDLNGNFVLNNLYYGTVDSFAVRPFKGNRQFEPPVQQIVLTTESPVQNQVLFSDISSFTISGTIRYAETGCAAADVPILVDSKPAGSTDTKGKFAVAMEIGKHWIRPNLEGHIFGPDSLFVNARRDTVVDDMTGVAFNDSTTRTLSGRFGGGCGRAIGDVTITIRSENDCLLKTLVHVSGDTAYNVSLPPQNYLVSASVDLATIPDSLSKTDVVRFFQNLGVRLAEMDSTDVAMDFVYRAPLQVRIKGFEDYVMCSGPLTFADRTLAEDLPVLPQGERIPLRIEVDEDYGVSGLCPLESGTVTIYDEISNRETQPFVLTVQNGVAACTTYAITPNLVVGRTDADGVDRSLQKAIQAVVEVEGRTPVTGTEWVLVTGRVAPEGADFVTAKGLPLPLIILRDPPGDRSYAYIETGHSLRTTIDYTGKLTTEEDGYQGSAWAGYSLSWWKGVTVGPAAGDWGSFSIGLAGNKSVLDGKMTNTANGTDVTLTTKSTFSTSGDDGFVGEPGDVFVGIGLNFKFTEVGVIDVDEDNCRVKRTTSMGFETDSIPTTFAYSDRYIRDTLIAQLDSTVAYYTRAGNDSAKMFEKMATNWRNALVQNDSSKAQAKFVESRSFSAGADYAYVYETDTTEVYSKYVYAITDSDWSAGLRVMWDYAEAIGLKAKIKHTETVDSFEDSTGTVSNAFGYVLSDDDIGDHFNVYIMKDNKYPSPVFDVRAGASSCPYEAWRDSTGAARMVPRDSVKISINGSYERAGVPPDEPAVFTLTLSNGNRNEGRLYALRLLTNTNPYGAVVKVGGVPLSNGLEYFIDPDQTLTTTLTVERGPTRYEYDDLALILYPPCEYEAWRNGAPLQRADTVKVSVTFAAPCSDITLMAPKSGWVFDRADQAASDSLDLLLSDFELEIGDDGGSIIDVGAEYRRLGVVQEGPGPWTVFKVISSPDPEGTLIQWLPPDSLEDGVYELRAYTHCQRGYGYSEVSTGTIERNGPMVLGAPQPSDGELSLGEEISITFNELIDCRSVLPDSVTLTYLDGPNTGAHIPLETVCDGTTIILTPTASASDLEGRRIEARVAGVKDKVGNAMEGARTWSFDYRKSRFTWSELHLTADLPYRAPGSVSADLVNGTGQPVEFTITTMPSWVTSATPATGTIPPGQKQAVSFAIQSDLMGGVYEGEVTAAAEDTTQGVAVFDMHVTVSCHEPEWAIDPSDFEHTMTMVTNLKIGGGFTADPNDKVAAFVGNQLRGVASVQEVAVGTLPYPYLAFLTVRSNRASGETVRFQVWDDSDCKLYNATDKSYPFVANSTIGTIGEPETLTATDVLAAGTLTIAVNEGWTWISTNMTSADMSVNALLSDLLPTSGDLFKSQAAFSQFVDEATGWSPDLGNVDNVSSYMLRLATPGTILHNGTPADMPVPVEQGWNWIGYLPQGPIDVTDALDDLDARTLVQAGDIVKGQDGFAEYVGGVWYGTLDVMEPGKGYKLYLGKDVDSSFVYPQYVSAPVVVAGGVVSEAVDPKTAAEGTPAWSVNPHAYQNNMTVTGVLRVGGVESIDERDLVAAFVGDECRGVTQPVYVDGLRRYEVFLMVHSNDAAGERVSLRAFDADAKAVYDITETLTFEADKVQGTVQSPVALTTGALHQEGGETIPKIFAMGQNHPNPFNPTTTIDYDVPSGGGKVTIRIYDVGGRLVRTLLDHNETPGRKTIAWDGMSNNGQTVATGVYFYRMTAPGFEKTLKMIMMK